MKVDIFELRRMKGRYDLSSQLCAKSCGIEASKKVRPERGAKP